MSLAGIALTAEVGDEQLVAAVRRGDDRAFEQLYGRYQRRIAGYVYGMVNDYGRAEDITQEIFVSALRRMRATERPIAFKPWIYEIARNACIDHFRRSRRSEEVSFDAEEAAGTLDVGRVPSSTSPDAAVHAKQQIDDLCGAFGGLSDTHHEILVMRELEGLSYREIGERLGLSRPSVESTLFRARRRLSEEYDELVSGERCRRVSELLASGAPALTGREERRLARHVAHCQPCRRQAYAAGVDTVTLMRKPRRGVARVAALLPLPAFVRLRMGSAGQWSGTAASLAEPATNWTKAVAAAAVLVAGGAGVAGHTGAADPGTRPAAPAAAPDGDRASHVREHRAPSAPRVSAIRRETAGATAPRDPTRRAARSAAPRRLPAAAMPSRPARTAPAPASAPAPPAPPSAHDVPDEQPQLPAVRADESATQAPATAPAPPAEPVVNVPATPDDAYDNVTNTVTMVNGEAGEALDTVGQNVGLGG
jgi:RNA polymerase sigma factor (sigma-70 family)